MPPIIVEMTMKRIKLCWAVVVEVKTSLRVCLQTTPVNNVFPINLHINSGLLVVACGESFTKQNEMPKELT